jgi:hypothetical protein
MAKRKIDISKIKVGDRVDKAKKCKCGSCQTGKTNHNPPRLKSNIVE